MPNVEGAKDLIIANHDLLLAAADMEPGSVLPDLADTMLVLDEAGGSAGFRRTT